MEVKFISVMLALAFLTTNYGSKDGKCALSVDTVEQEQPIAFPGAEGGGMFASGGRGGTVVFVTNLTDTDQPGSLRYALHLKQKRIIIFKISGTIFLKSPLHINVGDLTIAGQSAPGEGICVANYPVTVSADNIIIRYLRFRMGYHGSQGADGADALSGRQTNNVIIDHCSISWSTDECSSFYDNENFTMQWCIISESLRLSGHSKGPHGYGAIWGGLNATYHHNLLAHHDSRTPRFGPGDKFAGRDRVDVRNNVFYNWNGNGCYGGEAMTINLVNNYYKPGPATAKKIAERLITLNAKDGSNGFNSIQGVWGKYYIDGNVVAGNSKLSANNWNGVFIQGNNRSGIEALNPVSIAKIHTYAAEQAYRQVLANAGCSKFRDEIDLRIIKETQLGTATYTGLSPNNGTGRSAGYPRAGIIDSQLDLKPANASADWSPWPLLKSEAAPLDTDADGMPDSWELKKRLNAQHGEFQGKKRLHRYYDNVEVYLNELVASNIP